ncbi:hypothetical protein BaRGS_00013391, partial [Batillaria attramentaria]
TSGHTETVTVLTDEVTTESATVQFVVDLTTVTIFGIIAGAVVVICGTTKQIEPAPTHEAVREKDDESDEDNDLTGNVSLGVPDEHAPPPTTSRIPFVRPDVAYGHTSPAPADVPVVTQGAMATSFDQNVISNVSSVQTKADLNPTATPQETTPADRSGPTATGANSSPSSVVNTTDRTQQPTSSAPVSTPGPSTELGEYLIPMVSRAVKEDRDAAKNKVPLNENSGCRRYDNLCYSPVLFKPKGRFAEVKESSC